MLTNIISRVRHRVERLRNFREKRSLYRNWGTMNVHVHSEVDLRGISHISIGTGTTVHGGATLAATGLGFGERIDSPAWGWVRIGEHCNIMLGSVVASYGGTIELGNHVSINPYCIVYGHGGLRIGDRTRIAAHTVIVPANHVFDDPEKPTMDQGLSCKGIVIGQDVWIGAGARILDGVTIHDGAVVAAGSVITRDVPPRMIVAGVPARTISERGKRT